MQCKSEECCFWYNECIRKNVTIEHGKCPYFHKRAIRLFDIFSVPSIYQWRVSANNTYVDQKGHLLDVVARSGWSEATVSPIHGNAFVSRSPLPEHIDVELLLMGIITADIYAMYMEEFWYAYLSKSYHITKLDYSGAYVKVMGDLK
jgi:hypothetical protein